MLITDAFRKSRRRRLDIDAVPQSAQRETFTIRGLTLPYQSSNQGDRGERQDHRGNQPSRDQTCPPPLNAAQRMPSIPFRFIKETTRDIIGHERHPIGNVPSGDYLTSLKSIAASTIY
jgi:hypothetical protein